MFIQHADAELYAVDFGSSPRTLVAHGGWTGNWELWIEPFQYLSKDWRTVAYDHRGAGATLAPVESITHQALVGDLFAVLDAYGIQQCVLAAESSGVAVALGAAIQQPQRFEGLVLVDGLYHRTRPTSQDPFILGLQRDFQATIGNFVDACVPESEPNCAVIRRWGRQILNRASPPAAIRLLESLYDIDFRPQASQILLPTLILHGDADALVPLSESEWLAANLPKSHLQIIQGAGHVPSITRPREVAESINTFFARL